MAPKQAKKKILIVGQHFWPENFRINDICDFLKEKDCEIDVLCGIPNYPKGKFFSGYSLFKKRNEVNDGVRIYRALEIPRGNNSNFRIFLNYISFPISSLFHIPRLLTKKYDKIFIYQLSPVMMSIAGMIIGKIKKIETTMYVLDLWPENLYSVLDIKNTILRKLLEEISHWHYKHVDKIIVLSEKMKNRIQEVTNLPSEKIIIVPQSCEKIYEKNIHDLNLDKRFKNTFNILYAGNISPAQSFSTIIEAAKKVVSTGIKDIRWVIVGDGMSKNAVEKMVSEGNLQDYFVFEGMKPMEEIPKYQTIADALLGCLVKSDLLEATIPAKVISYFAAGKPILLGMDGEAQSLVNSLGCGLATPTEDSKSLANSILLLYKKTSKEREEMGKRSRAYYFENFERSVNLNKLYDFIFDS